MNNQSGQINLRAFVFMVLSGAFHAALALGVLNMNSPKIDSSTSSTEVIISAEAESASKEESNTPAETVVETPPEAKVNDIPAQTAAIPMPAEPIKKEQALPGKPIKKAQAIPKTLPAAKVTKQIEAPASVASAATPEQEQSVVVPENQPAELKPAEELNEEMTVALKPDDLAPVLESVDQEMKEDAELINTDLNSEVDVNEELDANLQKVEEAENQDLSESTQNLNQPAPAAPLTSAGSITATESITQSGAKEIRALEDLKQKPGNKKPIYTAEDRAKGRTGEVTFAGYVSKDGSVSGFKMIKSSGHRELDARTLTAIKTWKFQPGQEGWVEFPFKWDLKGDPQQMPGTLRRAKISQN